MNASSVEAVIDQLGDIVENSRRTGSRVGYFASLYRTVTVEVGKGIAAGWFEDGARIEHLDIVFANRYLRALDAYHKGEPLTQAWRFAFVTSGQWWPLVLQHLLLGVNAHINLDLGIAAARTSPGDSLIELRNDFNRINDILGALVDEVQEKLSRVWPSLRMLDRLGGSTDEAVVHFSMKKARDQSWEVARQLAFLSQTEQESWIAELDSRVTLLAKRIRHPGIILGAATKLIRLGERGSPPEIMGLLG